MGQRLALHEILKGITERVYFQPSANVAIQYPCIIYRWDGAQSQHADNKPYQYTKRYQVTVIDRNPDSALPVEVAKLPMCEFDRFFPADDLNHFVFNLFF